jgi:Cu(I)/Ag(I) efflux system membrane fusion protein
MAADGGVTLKSNSITALNVQTVAVARQPLVRTLRVAGNIVANSWTAAWFEFTAYEHDFAWLKIGQTVEVSLPSAPGKTYQAQIKLRSSRPVVDTDFDMATGSTKVRAEISEPPVSAGELGEKKLFNNLYAEGRVLVDLPDVLTVPRSAVLSPGAQAVVYVDAGGGHYEPRKIKTGRVGDDLVEVLEGLDAGEKVVTTGSLLIDAETQISQSGN